MQITIDTKHDSPEDIRRVVKMLEALLEGHIAAPFDMFGSIGSGSSGSSSETSNSLGSSDNPSQGTSIFSLFDDTKQGQQSLGSVQSSVIKRDFNDDDIPPIIPYS